VVEIRAGSQKLLSQFLTFSWKKSKTFSSKTIFIYFCNDSL